MISLDILKAGGNAADAAVAVAAAMNVYQPTGGSIGGDVFIMYERLPADRGQHWRRCVYNV